MTDNLYTNNQATIIGESISPFEFYHEFKGESFYRIVVRVERYSMTSRRVWMAAMVTSGMSFMASKSSRFRTNSP